MDIRDSETNKEIKTKYSACKMLKKMGCKKIIINHVIKGVKIDVFGVVGKKKIGICFGSNSAQTKKADVCDIFYFFDYNGDVFRIVNIKKVSEERIKIIKELENEVGGCEEKTGGQATQKNVER